jgi:hypothetical protein
VDQDDKAAFLQVPLEPGDWYFEGPDIVFTAQYLLKRGTCCGSGCRHCPYGQGGRRLKTDQTTEIARRFKGITGKLERAAIDAAVA